MTPEQRKALQTILEYLESEEFHHYQECPPELRERHIYNDILILSNFLKQEQACQ